MSRQSASKLIENACYGHYECQHKVLPADSKNKDSGVRRLRGGNSSVEISFKEMNSKGLSQILYSMFLNENESSQGINIYIPSEKMKLSYEFLSKTKQRERHQELMGAIGHDSNLPREKIDAIAVGLVRDEFMQAACSVMEEIPIYKDEKEAGRSKDALHHFDLYWRELRDYGLLFQHLIPEKHKSFLSDLNGQVRRRAKRDQTLTDHYRVPSQVEYNDVLFRRPESVFWPESTRISAVINRRQIG